jgi:hypothetical protein
MSPRLGGFGASSISLGVPVLRISEVTYVTCAPDALATSLFVAVGLAILYAQILSAFDFFMSFSYSSLKISLPSSIGNSMVVILKSHVLHTLLRLTVGKP